VRCLASVCGLKTAGAKRPSSGAAVRRERPGESERRQGRVIWYTRALSRFVRGKRPPDCAPFVPQGERDDSYKRRAAESTAKTKEPAGRRRYERRRRRATRQRKEPAGCPSAPLGTSRRYKGKGDSVSASNIPAVVRYIRNQESHHRKINFETEFLALLKKHNVEFDPKFVFG
jgi:hypothetical protein